MGRSKVNYRTGRRIRRYLVILQTSRPKARWVKVIDALSREEARELTGAGPGDMVLTEGDALKLARFIESVVTGNSEAWGLAFRVPK